ncbi:MAG TPA: methyltransferase domain-containing protein [Gemmatimonadaceae bacterium]|jgi:SAM-dependent methyltransferase|nr:methyltransferase domain-containing protein [Gemmatimonadaceae bacterium]
MMHVGLVPRRRRGVELLDDPAADAMLATRSLRDVALANRLFGGTSAVLSSLAPLLRDAAGAITLLDVGTGAGDIPERSRALAARLGARLTTVGLERTLPVARAARARADVTCVGDAMRLPFRDRAFDIVTCSQVLHHFTDPDAALVLREMHRVAARLVVVADLRRSWPAAAGIWAASFALGFHPVSRHDGVLSVLRGYRRTELAALVASAVDVTPVVRDRPGFRVTATWRTA